ncbi:MAG: S-layer homology domain-containing protein [Clostridia bacterium]|nr:S-layer homology domain-containing protein [Clostridia bacterium]
MAAPQPPEVTASGAIVIDFDTGGAYYEKNADTARPAASMTKIMSAYIVFEEIVSGRLSYDTYIKISAHAAAVSNDTTYSGYELFKEGDKYKVDTLLKLVFTASGNASMIALAEHISGSEDEFVKRMNKRAAAIGLNARFADSCGIKDEGNSVTPRDMALLSQQIIKDYPRVLKYSSLKSYDFGGRTFTSTNLLLVNGSLSGVDGLKTGTTSAAGYCFAATAKQSGRRMIAVVMNSSGSQSRANDCKKLLEYAFECASSGSAGEKAPKTIVSGWAEKEVAAAKEAGLLTDGLGSDYTVPVSRFDAVHLFIKLLERSSGMSAEELMAQRGVSAQSGAFSDTSDNEVLFLNALGIINGVGQGKFDPNGTLTRAQAAAMINRTARILGIETGGFTHGFKDAGDHWVNSELGFAVNAGIIKGISEDRFAPDAKLTTEQAAVIIYRAFEAFKHS